MPVKILPATGAGSVTVQAENAISSDFTLTMPGRTGNIITSVDSGTVTQAMLASGVAGNGPAFMAYLGTSQNVSNNTWTKLNINTEETNGDPNSCYDTSLYRFTPNVAGYYLIIANADGGGSGITGVHVAIYLNGSLHKLGGANYSGLSATFGESVTNVSAIIRMNGTTDYVEMYGRVLGSSGQIFYAGVSPTFFTGSLIRSA